MIIRHIIRSNSWIWFFGAEIPLTTRHTTNVVEKGFVQCWKEGYITHCNICFAPILILRVFIRPFVSIYQSFKWKFITKPRNYIWYKIGPFINFIYCKHIYL
jgi:hypothetical protein